ncbi:hypothetical protein KI387_003232, partial [Taxus chinensis]
KEEAAHQHQFILHAALDIVQDLQWTTSAMFLKGVDRFSDLVVSVYVTAVSIASSLVCIPLSTSTTSATLGARPPPPRVAHTRLMLLHDSRNEDGIKNFFQEVHELYIK